MGDGLCYVRPVESDISLLATEGLDPATESVPPTVVPGAKGGAGCHLSDAERTNIQIAFLTENTTIAALARRLGRTRETIAGCLRGDGFDQVKKEILEQKAEARSDATGERGG